MSIQHYNNYMYTHIKLKFNMKAFQQKTSKNIIYIHNFDLIHISCMRMYGGFFQDSFNVKDIT